MLSSLVIFVAQENTGYSFLLCFILLMLTVALALTSLLSPLAVAYGCTYVASEKEQVISVPVFEN